MSVCAKLSVSSNPARHQAQANDRIASAEQTRDPVVFFPRQHIKQIEGCPAIYSLLLAKHFRICWEILEISMSTRQASAAPVAQLPWLIIVCGCLIAMMTFGPRSAMGFFQIPMLTEKGWDRTTFGLAMAIQNLAWGIGQPIFGALADKFGTWRMLLLSGILYASGLFLMSGVDSPTMLYISGGVLIGLGVAAGSFTIVLSAFARNVSAESRSFVFGLGTAAVRPACSLSHRWARV
jgi:hypothetical protein